MNTLKTIEYKNHTIKIFHDELCESPRTMWDNLGVMCCFHKKYNIGDKHDFSISEYESWDKFIKYPTFQEYLFNAHGACVLLPLYLYDHSGLSISTSPFNCKFDSGKIGFIYATKEKIKNHFMIAEINEQTLETVKSILECEVKEYNQYLSGECYGYEIFNSLGESVGSCYGFIGDMDYCLQSAKEIADYEETKENDAKDFERAYMTC